MPSFALIADADDGARAELAQLVARLNYEIVEAVTGEEALELARHRTPSLVVLDVGLPGGSAYEICRELREVHGHRLPIIFVSADRTEAADEVAGLLLGADEYFAKPIAAELFLVRTRRLILRSSARASGGSTLTPREREVLGLLVQGVARPEIARRLHITDKTAATHIEHILGKLGAHSQAQAVAFAVRDRLVEAAA
jgi:DNA-binding NarL/FixJ family response regulator